MVQRGEVLPDWKIKELIEQEVIIGADTSLINPSSLDLRLGMEKWKLLGSFLPLDGQTIEEVLQSRRVLDEKEDKKEGFYIDKSQPYLFKLVESLNLPSSLTARIHNKSGRGRIGISTKGLVDRVSRFDNIPAGYSGNIYAEICTTAFPIMIDGGKSAIPQIRFYNGEPQPIGGSDLDLLLRKHPVLTDSEGNHSYTDVQREEIFKTGKLTFHADLSDKILVYRANRDNRTLVLSETNHYIPEEFFEAEMRRDNSQNKVLIHPGDFVLIKSKEHIRLPPEFAAEISDYSTDLGDLKSHYAGLVNSGHGYDPKNPNVPSYIVFEVRARDLPAVIQDGQSLAKFEIHRMFGMPEQSYMSKRSTDYNDLRSILPSNFKKD